MLLALALDRGKMLLVLQLHLMLLLLGVVDLELLQLLGGEKRLYMAALVTLWIRSVRGQAEVSHFSTASIDLSCCNLELLNLIPQSIVQCYM